MPIPKKREPLFMPKAGPVYIRNADGTYEVKRAYTYRERRNLASTGHVHVRAGIRPQLRKAVLERDGYRCVYCGTDVGPFQMDHVRPYSKGGWETMANLVTACRPCNLRKSNRWDRTSKRPR